MKSVKYFFAAGIIMMGSLMANAQESKGELKLDPFHSIELSSEIDAELVLSKEEKLEHAIKGAQPGDLIVEVDNGVLRIRMKTGRYRDASIKVRIHYKDIRSLEVNGRAVLWSEEDIYLDEDLTIKCFNGGEVRFRLFCESLEADVSQGSIIHLEGKARTLDIKSTTGATFSGYEFETEETTATASSGGKIKVSVKQRLVAKANTKGFIGYVGEPAKVDRNASLGGEIIETYLEE